MLTAYGAYLEAHCPEIRTELGTLFDKPTLVIRAPRHLNSVVVDLSIAFSNETGHHLMRRDSVWRPDPE